LFAAKDRERKNPRRVLQGLRGQASNASRENRLFGNRTNCFIGTRESLRKWPFVYFPLGDPRACDRVRSVWHGLNLAIAHVLTSASPRIAAAVNPAKTIFHSVTTIIAAWLLIIVLCYFENSFDSYVRMNFISKRVPDGFSRTFRYRHYVRFEISQNINRITLGIQLQTERNAFFRPRLSRNESHAYGNFKRWFRFYRITEISNGI